LIDLGTLAAIAVFVGLLSLLPLAMRRLKAEKHGRLAGVAMAVGFAFSALFKPAKGEATVEIDRQKQRRDQHGESETENDDVVNDKDDGGAQRL
jgi:hypothetical protein